MKLSTLEKAIFTTQKNIESLEEKVNNYIEQLETTESYVEYTDITYEMKIYIDDLQGEKQYLQKLFHDRAKKYKEGIKSTKQLITSIEKELQNVLHQSWQTGFLERLEFNIPQVELLIKLNNEVFSLKIESLSTQLQLHKELPQHLQKGANL